MHAAYAFVQAVKELDKGRPAWHNVYLCRKELERILREIENEQRENAVK